MKLTSKIIGPAVIVIIAGGIALSVGLNLWQTESKKVPVKYSVGAFAGEFYPGDIRGSYSFDDIAASFEITADALAKAFGMGATENPGSIKAKDLEAVYGEVDGREIGTDSIRYFVALYTGLPYEPNENTVLPGPALSVLREKLNEEQLESVKARIVSISGITTGSVGTEEHVENTDAMVKGKTTFGELLDWGLTDAEIEKAIGMEMGKTGVTVRDHVVAAGVEFSQAKAKLQALLDAN